jgi:nucleoside-diphosphate-sugar epimerase
VKRNVITGATGLLGSHIAEQLVARGEMVRALVRPSADTTFLKSLGAEVVVSDYNDPQSLQRAFDGADIVYHCAARVGEWGPWRQFQEQIIDVAARVFDACRVARVGRLLHVSSISVYGHPPDRAELFTEGEPIGQNLWSWDNYCRAKIAAEKLCHDYQGDWTVVRPSWIYGPRDRNSFPRALKALIAGRVAITGHGDNLLNIVYAGDVAEGAILAANNPNSIFKAYNLSSDGEITQEQFVNMLTDALGLVRIRRHVSFRLAFAGAYLGEVIARVIRLHRSPHITRYAVALIGRSTRFSSERAKTELGWRPHVSIAEGVRRTLEDFRAREKANQVASAPGVG